MWTVKVLENRLAFTSKGKLKQKGLQTNIQYIFSHRIGNFLFLRQSLWNFITKALEYFTASLVCRSRSYIWKSSPCSSCSAACYFVSQIGSHNIAWELSEIHFLDKLLIFSLTKLLVKVFSIVWYLFWQKLITLI